MKNKFSHQCCCAGLDDPCFVEWLVEETVATGGSVLTGSGSINESLDDHYGIDFDYSIITEITPIDAMDELAPILSTIRSRLLPLFFNRPTIDFVDIASQLESLPEPDPPLDLAFSDYRQDAIDRLILNADAFTDLIDFITAFQDDVFGIPTGVNDAIDSLYFSGRIYVITQVSLQPVIDAANTLLALVAEMESLWQEIHSGIISLMENPGQTNNEVDQIRIDSIDLIDNVSEMQGKYNSASSQIDGMISLAGAVTISLVDWTGLEVDDNYATITGDSVTLPAIPAFGTAPTQTNAFTTLINATQWPTPTGVFHEERGHSRVLIEHVRQTRVVDDSVSTEPETPLEEGEEPPREEYFTLTKGVTGYSPSFGIDDTIFAASHSTHSYDTRPNPTGVYESTGWPNIRIVLPDAAIPFFVRSYRSRCINAPLHPCPLTHRRFQSEMSGTITGYPNEILCYETTTDVFFDRVFDFNADPPTCCIMQRNSRFTVKWFGLDGKNGTYVSTTGDIGTGIAVVSEQDLLDSPLDEHVWYNLKADATRSFDPATVVPFREVVLDAQVQNSCGESIYEREVTDFPVFAEPGITPRVPATCRIQGESFSDTSPSYTVDGPESGGPVSCPLVTCEGDDFPLQEGFTVTTSEYLGARDDDVAETGYRDCDDNLVLYTRTITFEFGEMVGVSTSITIEWTGDTPHAL